MASTTKPGRQQTPTLKVVDKSTFIEKWNYNSKEGRRDILCSFILVNKNSQPSGTLRVPESFHLSHGVTLPRSIYIKCQNCVWRVKYNASEMMIFGLRKFMMYYGVKLFNFILFDYCGDEIFDVTIFKESAIECSYPATDPRTLVWKDLLKEQKLGESGTVDYDQRATLLWFNGLLNISEYHEIELNKNNINGTLSNMALENKLAKLFREWTDDSKFFLKLGSTSWEIDIKWIGSNCILGGGWSKFVQDNNMVVGDLLLLYKESSLNPKNLRVCIFKSHDLMAANVGVSGVSKRSFFKIVSEDCLQSDSMVVPKFVKNLYSDKLQTVEKVEAGGQLFNIWYSSADGMLLDFEELLKKFNVRRNEMIVFTIEDNNVLTARVYQFDGLEIDYYRRTLKSTINPIADYFWTFEWMCHREDERMKEHAGVGISVNTYVPKFIADIVYESSAKASLIVPEMIANTIINDPVNAYFHLPTGQKFSVHFRKSCRTVRNIECLVNECKISDGSVFIVSYEGPGNFMINILNSDGSEVEYFIPENPSWDVCSQDKIDGCGWKFISAVDNYTICNGEFMVPTTFIDRFGKNIPAHVICSLPDGKFVEGRYSIYKEMLYGLKDIVQEAELSEDDVLLFTYWGTGKFDIVVFDKSKIEKTFGVDGNNNNVQDNLHHRIEDNVQDMQLDELLFVASLTKSNTDGKSHGVYIPSHITPRDRQWRENETITLRTERGEWTVGLVFSGVLPRMSSGWNKFAKENNLKTIRKLQFTVIENELNGIVFMVSRV